MVSERLAWVAKYHHTDSYTEEQMSQKGWYTLGRLPRAVTGRSHSKPPQMAQVSKALKDNQLLIIAN